MIEEQQPARALPFRGRKEKVRCGNREPGGPSQLLLDVLTTAPIITAMTNTSRAPSRYARVALPVRRREEVGRSRDIR